MNTPNTSGHEQLDDETGREVVLRLQRWVTGLYSDTVDGPSSTETLVVESLEDTSHAYSAPGLIGDDTLALVPAGSDRPASSWCVTYQGSITSTAEEFSIDNGFFIQPEDYVSSAFLPIAGPAVVRIVTDSDYAAFLDDADLARSDGTFPKHLTNPLVQLGDQCALGSIHTCAAVRLRRVLVAEGGVIRSAPGGARLGSVVDATDSSAAEARALLATGADPCLAGVVPPDELREARLARPWLSRYLWALEGIRQLEARNIPTPKVSGFGGQIGSTDYDPERAEPAAAPLLLWTEGEAYLFHPQQGRVFKIGVDAAQLLEIASGAESFDAACVMSAKHLGISRDTAGKALGKLSERFSASGVALPLPQ